MIRDHIVEATAHSALRERFLQDRTLTLDRVLELSEAYEQSRRDATAMASQPAPPYGAPAAQMRWLTDEPRRRRRHQATCAGSDSARQRPDTAHPSRAGGARPAPLRSEAARSVSGSESGVCTKCGYRITRTRTAVQPMEPSAGDVATSDTLQRFAGQVDRAGALTGHVTS